MMSTHHPSAATDLNARRMLFVVGNSRSGTTMLGRILGRNSAVHKFPELHLFGPCVPHGDELKTVDKPEAIRIYSWLLDVADRKLHAERQPEKYLAEATQLAASSLLTGSENAWDLYQYFLFYEVAKHGKTIPSEDLPGNVFKLDQLLSRFPEARIIHIVRDPRDVLLSQKNRRNRRKMGATYVGRKETMRFWANYHPLFISRLWNNAVRAGLKVKDPRLITIHFEDLISNPAQVIKTVCQHAGIDFQEDMLRIPQVGSSTRKDSPDQLGIDAGRSGAWSKGGLTAMEIEICEKVNSALMQQLGYTKSGMKGALPERIWLMLLLPVKGIVALLLNWKRTKGLFKYMTQRFKTKS